MICELEHIETREVIYIEDIESLLMENEILERNEVTEYCKRISKGESDILFKTVKSHLSKKNLASPKNVYTLNNICTKIKNGQVASKKLTNIVETNMINLVSNILEDTNGKIIYKTQLDLIISTLGRVFLWEELSERDMTSKEHLMGYLHVNMYESKDVYPSLVKYLDTIIYTNDLSKDALKFISPNNEENLIYLEYIRNFS